MLFPFYARLRGDGSVDDRRRPAAGLSPDDPAGRDGGLARGLRHGRARPAAGPRRSTGRNGARRPRRWRSSPIWAGLASLASMPGAVFKALGRSWLLTATGIMQIAILFPAIWFAAPHGITAVAAVQVAEKTSRWPCSGSSSAACWASAGTRPSLPARPRSALSALMGAVLYALAATLPPGAALAVGIPLGAALYLLLLRGCRPTASGCSCARCSTCGAGTVAGAGWRCCCVARCCWSGAAAAPRPPGAPRALPIRAGAAAPSIVAPGAPTRGPGTREPSVQDASRTRSRGCATASACTCAAGPTPSGSSVDGRAGPPARARAREQLPGERPVLRGQLWIGDPSYWTIRGLNVKWAAGNPDEPLVRIYGGTGWRLTRLGDLGRALDLGPADRRRAAQQPRPLAGQRQLHPRHVPHQRTRTRTTTSTWRT